MNNDEGLVAVSADAAIDQDHSRHIWSDILLIDKKIGSFRHVSGETGFGTEMVHNGSCVNY